MNHTQIYFRYLVSKLSRSPSLVSKLSRSSFSINNGKYEFLRMPFGLTSTPRIFQRAMDNILSEQVGKTSHVYMDVNIIFAKTIEQHYKD